MRIFAIISFSLFFLVIACFSYPKKLSYRIVAEFKKGNKMDEQEFWKIIDYAFNNSEGDTKKQAQIITQKLSDYTPNEIIDFEFIFRRKVILANDFKIMAAEKIIEGSVSDDSYLYFRCWLIGHGQKTFEQTIKNPDYLASIVKKGTETDFEDLLYVSTGAYRNRTGKKKKMTVFQEM